MKGEINMKTYNYQLINYFDVWGNAEDGYEVNNLCKEGEPITMTEDVTNKEIIGCLKQIGFLSEKANCDNIYVSMIDPEMIEIFVDEDMYPLGRLELIRD